MGEVLVAAGLAAAVLAAAGLAAGVFVLAGMARMWAVSGPESMRDGEAVNHSAGCMAGIRAGLSRAQAGRSNRTRSGVPRTAQYQASAPTTPAAVTSSDMGPRSVRMPDFSSAMRVSALRR